MKDNFDSSQKATAFAKQVENLGVMVPGISILYKIMQMDGKIETMNIGNVSSFVWVLTGATQAAYCYKQLNTLTFKEMETINQASAAGLYVELKNWSTTFYHNNNRKKDFGLQYNTKSNEEGVDVEYLSVQFPQALRTENLIQPIKQGIVRHHQTSKYLFFVAGHQSPDSPISSLSKTLIDKVGFFQAKLAHLIPSEPLTEIVAYAKGSG